MTSRNVTKLLLHCLTPNIRDHEMEFIRTLAGRYQGRIWGNYLQNINIWFQNVHDLHLFITELQTCPDYKFLPIEEGKSQLQDATGTVICTVQINVGKPVEDCNINCLVSQFINGEWVCESLCEESVSELLAAIDRKECRLLESYVSRYLPDLSDPNFRQTIRQYKQAWTVIFKSEDSELEARVLQIIENPNLQSDPQPQPGGLRHIFAMAADIMSRVGYVPPAGMAPLTDSEMQQAISNVFTTPSTLNVGDIFVRGDGLD